MASFLGVKLKKHRLEKHYSLDKLAELTGSSKSYIWELENRPNKRPSADLISKIASVLEVSTDYLIQKSEKVDNEKEKDLLFKDFQKLSSDNQRIIKLIIKTWIKKNVKTYLNLIRKVLNEGDYKLGRNGQVYSLFGEQLKIDLSEGFPLLTTKFVHFKSVAYELLWFLKGDTNIKYLQDNDVTIWNEWADELGDLGPVYGKQWKHANQLERVINDLKRKDYSRRLLVCSWNAMDIPKMALPPCHCLFQFYVSNNRLSLHVYQRSADIFLGVPFNIASYALLANMVANSLDLRLGDLIFSYGDLHLYENHVRVAKKQLDRKPYSLCKLSFREKIDDIFNVDYNNFVINDYQHHPRLTAGVSK